MTPWQRSSFSTSFHAKNSSYTVMSRFTSCSYSTWIEDVTGDVGREHRARRAGCAERPLCQLPVLAPREDGTPVLELVDVARRLAAQDLDRVLVADVVGALDGVERVRRRRVLGGVPERRVDPAFGRAGVAAGRVELRDHTDVGTRVVCLDRRPHAGAPGTDDEDVVRRFHVDGRYRKSCRSRARSCPVRGTPRTARSRARSAFAHARSRVTRSATAASRSSAVAASHVFRLEDPQRPVGAVEPLRSVHLGQARLDEPAASAVRARGSGRGSGSAA